MEEKITKLDRKIIYGRKKGKRKTIRCCCCGAKIGSVKIIEMNDRTTRCIIEGLTNDTSEQKNLVILVQLLKKVRPIGICVSCKHNVFDNYPGYNDNDIHARFDYVMHYIDEKQPNDVKKKSKLRLKACKQFEKELLDKARND